MVDTSGTPAGGRPASGAAEAAARPKANPIHRAADLSSEAPIDQSDVEDDEEDDEEDVDDDKRSAVCVVRKASSVQSSPRCMSSICGGNTHRCGTREKADHAGSRTEFKMKTLR